MNAETLKIANEISDRIRSLSAAKANVSDESFYNKNRRGIPEDILTIGKTAMLAALDEAIDAAQKELDAL